MQRTKLYRRKSQIPILELEKESRIQLPYRSAVYYDPLSALHTMGVTGDQHQMSLEIATVGNEAEIESSRSISTLQALKSVRLVCEYFHNQRMEMPALIWLADWHPICQHLECNIGEDQHLAWGTAGSRGEC